MNPLLVLVGPTAVGKTAAAIELARRLDGEIVTADSVQVYIGMDIGSAKPDIRERAAAKHHMIDLVEPDVPYNVMLYKQAAVTVIDDIHARGKLPILAGGTGLYVNSLVYPMEFNEASYDEDYRESLRRFSDEHGAEALHQRLACVDAEAAASIHPNNQKRVIRALEVHHLTGRPFSSFQTTYREQPPPYDLTMVGLTMPRSLLYERIEQRVEDMMAHNFLDEVATLLSKYPQDCHAFDSLGYRQLIAYMEGDYSLPEAIQQIKRETRRFAKRQFTWFNRDQRIRWYSVLNYRRIEDMIVDIIQMENIER
ncbi:MAG: tRNA (adenosine(37)-N6)-dimethylallyltransferase MiaA [Christensenellales bacterium]|jgi:tRNA dimethylallyltransferase